MIISPFIFLEALLQQWLLRPITSQRYARLAAQAIGKDIEHLLSTCPLHLSSWLPGDFSEHEQLSVFVQDTATFMKESVRCHLPVNAGPRPLLVSPLSGGCPGPAASTSMPGKSKEVFKIGCLNPGPLGFSDIPGTDTFWWRLWSVAEFGVSEHLHIVIIPGARFPTGVCLPEGFPYIYVGPKGPSWGTVGLFVLPTIADALHILEDHSATDRRLWFAVKLHSKQTLHICALYGPPGGDAQFYRDTVAEAQAFPQYLLIGDFNIHFPHLVEHQSECTCSHCAPSGGDKAAHRALTRAGLTCANPAGRATHSSGTIIDLVMSSHDNLVQSVVVKKPGSVAGSDHGALICTVTDAITACEAQGFGRVAWTSGEEWAVALDIIAPILEVLALVIDSLRSHPALLQATRDQKKLRQRRLILDAIVWIRDTWYTLAGHLGGAVRASMPRRPATCDPSEFSVTGQMQAMSRRNHRQWVRYMEARADNPSHASKILSGILAPALPLQVHMVDPTSGDNLDQGETMQAIFDDILSRPAAAQPLDAEYTRSLQLKISSIRRSGAQFDPEANCATCPGTDEGDFCEDELSLVLDGVNASRNAFRSSLAAVKASCPAGRMLTLALMNCSLDWCISATVWGMRQFNPIRKSGPVIVTRLKCLRPVSQASDLAAIQDGLFIVRHREKLLHYWGPSQYGGVYESLAAVLHITLLAQLRMGAGLPLIFNFVDEQSGFDVKGKNDIRLGAFRAGVCGRSWMLLDDILNTDQVRLAFMSLVTSWVHTTAGIGQGRKASSFHFNTAARLFADQISTVSAGVAAHTNRLPATLLREAQRLVPATCCTYSPLQCRILLPRMQQISGELQRQALLLSTLVSSADRLVTLDLLNSPRHSIIQYIDDSVMPASSFGQSSEIWSACETYSSRNGPRFNIGRSKSAILPVGDVSQDSAATLTLPTYFGQVIHPVMDYKYMGVLLDSFFTFCAHLKQSLARWQAAFDHLVGAAFSISLPFALTAAVVPERAESVAIYGIALCLAVSGAEASLNRMQADWARTLLGIAGYSQGHWCYLIAQCGWRRRLGTRMLAEAVMLESRVLLLPEHIPVRQLLLQARLTTFSCWAHEVCRVRRRLGDIPDIIAWAGPDAVDMIRNDLSARKACLTKFRVKVLYPALDSYDLSAFCSVQDEWPFRSFHHFLDPQDNKILVATWGHTQWKMFRCWSLVRATGRWPLPLYGLEYLPRSLDKCPLCGKLNADIAHLLRRCTSTKCLRSEHDIPRTSWSSLRHLLFAGVTAVSPDGSLAPHIQFVAACFNQAAVALQSEAVLQDALHDIVECNVGQPEDMGTHLIRR
jgi:hypothetical protein